MSSRPHSDPIGVKTRYQHLTEKHNNLKADHMKLKADHKKLKFCIHHGIKCTRCGGMCHQEGDPECPLQHKKTWDDKMHRAGGAISLLKFLNPKDTTKATMAFGKDHVLTRDSFVAFAIEQMKPIVAGDGEDEEKEPITLKPSVIHGAARRLLDLFPGKTGGELLAEFKKIKTEKRFNEMAMAYAAKEGDVRLVDYLIRAGVDMERRVPLLSPAASRLLLYSERLRQAPRTVLMIASAEGHLAVVDLLIKAGAHVDALTVYDETALITVCKSKNMDIVNLLIDNGANLFSKTADLRTVLMQASFYGLTDLVARIISNIPPDRPQHVRNYLNQREDINQKTALMLACEGEHKDKDIVRLLIDNGADVDAKDDNGKTALILATMGGRTDMVDLLIKADADMDAKSNYGNTAMMMACDRGDTDIVRLLIDNGADMDAKDNHGYTAMMIAIEMGYSSHKDILSLLVYNGADVDAKDNDGSTALMSAVSNGQTEIVDLLLNDGADVNAADSDGQTALMFACEEEHKDIVRLLIEKGADPTLKDDEDRTAFTIATSKNNMGITLLLSKANRRPNV